MTQSLKVKGLEEKERTVIQRNHIDKNECQNPLLIQLKVKERKPEMLRQG